MATRTEGCPELGKNCKWPTSSAHIFAVSKHGADEIERPEKVDSTRRWALLLQSKLEHFNMSWGLFNPFQMGMVHNLSSPVPPKKMDGLPTKTWCVMWFLSQAQARWCQTFRIHRRVWVVFLCGSVTGGTCFFVSSILVDRDESIFLGFPLLPMK